MSSYLSAADRLAFGVPGATDAQVIAASGLVDAYIDRPEGIAFATDFAGRPCYMAGLTPVLSFTLAADIAPGQNVTATLQGGFISNDLIGEVLIADRANGQNTEALVVTGVNGAIVTFQSVGLAHTAGAVLETGLVLLEERPMPAKRSVTRVSKFPLVRVISGLGRYAYGRRSDQVAGLYNDTNLLAALQTFGGPPAWVPFDVSQASVSAVTGEVWVPAGLMLAYYSDVRLRYVAGYPLAALPTAIRQATATLVTALTQYPELTSNIKKLTAGGTSVERFGNSLLSADTKDQLEPFKAKLLF